MANQISQPGFGSYLLALSLPFLYFFIRGRVVAGIICLIICAVSLPLMLFMVGFISYGIMACWAIWGVKTDILESHAQRTGQATAEAIVAEQRRAHEGA